jgi:hypothetical protein
MSVSSPIHEAAAAVVELINSSPRSPRVEEIEAVLSRIGIAPQDAPPISDLRVRLHEAIVRHDEALSRASKLLPGAECDCAEADLETWGDAIGALEAAIPNPPRSYQDIVARAEIARHGGDVVDGKLMEAEDEEDVFLGPAARLVEAVLKFGGCGNTSAMSPAHAEHFREWRTLIDEHAHNFPSGEEDGRTPAEIKADEARMGEHLEEISQRACRILAEPVHPWGDVALRAQIFAWQYWPGVNIEGPEAPEQIAAGPVSVIEDHDLASLLGAIFTVAGVGQFAEVRHG